MTETGRVSAPHARGSRRPAVRACMRIAVLGLAVLLGACAAAPIAPALPAEADAIAAAMAGHAVVLLGEVHDSPVQHRLRVEALRLRIAAGERPALAFEQFDTERQSDIERARRERPRDADYLIAQASPAKSGWNWALYRPFVQLALDHDLPIVAANLGRAPAKRVAREGWGALFDSAAQTALGLDRIAPAVLAIQREDIDAGHCGMLPASALDGLVRAQIARDITLAQAVRPHAARGIVLLTGNGHARRDVGVPIWLRDLAPGTAVSIGLIEHGDDANAAELAARFDAYAVTARAERPDPCAEFKRK